MKNSLFASLILCLFMSPATAQVNMPAPSPTQTIKQDFGIGTIELTYSRPSVKGRTIYGDLVPFNKLWRTGANAATKLFFSEPAEIGGKKIDSGTYVLYSIPGIDSWEIILNKGLDNWGTEGYKQSQDIVRFKVEPFKMKTSVETFTIDFSDVTPETCSLNIKWEKTLVPILIVANFREKVKAQLEAAMKTDRKPYWQAAQFYNEYEKNLPAALENVSKALEENKDAYWMWLYKAKIQKDLGDTAGAIESSKRSMELAKAAKNDDYEKMNKELQKTLK